MKQKVCPRCSQTKDLSCFHRSSYTNDGYACWCKQCKAESHKEYMKSPQGKQTAARAMKKYAATEKGKEWRRRGNASEAHKVAERKHYLSAHGKERRRRYLQTEAGKAMQRRSVNKASVKQRQNHPDKCRARDHTKYLVRTKQIPPVRTLLCRFCGEPAFQYHHHLGYKREHWGDIIPLCKTCHIFEHFPELKALAG